MPEQEMELRDYLFVLKKRWKVLAKIAVSGFIVASIFVSLQPALYQATAVIEQAKIDKNPVENADILGVLFKKSYEPYLKVIAGKMDVSEKDAFNLTKMFTIEEVKESVEIKDKKIASGYILVTGKGRTPAEAKKLVDVIISLIIERQNNMLRDTLKIINGEIADLKEQIQNIKSDVELINKKIMQKEKTDILAQSYVFQTMAESKENALKRQIDLQNKLTAKEMDAKYYTKLAELSAAPSIPKNKMASHKVRIIFLVTLVCSAVAVFIIFVTDYLEKNPL